MMRPLILDAAGTTLSPLGLGESPKTIRAEFEPEGAESKEVFKLPLEQPLEGVSDEGLEWKECMAVLGTAGRGSE